MLLSSALAELMFSALCVNNCRDFAPASTTSLELESAAELGVQTPGLDLGIKSADFGNVKLVNGASSAVCAASVDLNDLDYKDVALLQSYLSELGHILPRVETGLSPKQHRKLIKEVKKSRYLGLLPFSLY
ncbi:MAG: 30S ribosomal protein S18 [Candidatus Hodgkinia cicadicola]|nr:MAG: 30S ribosomal protein S18 [Candidatus Hodgkinia cicadicola]